MGRVQRQKAFQVGEGRSSQGRSRGQEAAVCWRPGFAKENDGGEARGGREKCVGVYVRSLWYMTRGGTKMVVKKGARRA